MDLIDILAALRRHWRIPAVTAAIAVVVLALAVVLRPGAEEKFTATAVLRFPTTNDAGQVPNAPPELSDEPSRQIAPLEEETFIRAAYERAEVPVGLADDVGLSVAADDKGGVVEISFTSTERVVVDVLPDAYAEELFERRQAIVAADLALRQSETLTTIETLRVRRDQLVEQLGPLNLLALAASDDEDSTTPPPALTQEEQLLLTELIALNQRIAELESSFGDLAARAVTPDPYGRLVDVRETRARFDEAWPIFLPVLVLFGAVVIIGLGGAIAADRLDTSIRSSRSAARAFRAPVLGAVPRPRRNEAEPVVVHQHSSDRAKAFRALAATAMASDTLPSVVLVAEPTGHRSGEVAANFAAGLATLGMRTGLLIADPSQNGLVGEFAPVGDADEVGFDRMLDRARELDDRSLGRSENVKQFYGMLHQTERAPNLFVAPPGETAASDLSLAGLDNLLATLKQSDLDIIVIAGPPLLDEPNAMILAHHAGAVLWAVEVGLIDQHVAEAASNRLELTGVHGFGLVLVGAAES